MLTLQRGAAAGSPLNLLFSPDHVRGNFYKIIREVTDSVKMK